MTLCHTRSPVRSEFRAQRNMQMAATPKGAAVNSPVWPLPKPNDRTKQWHPQRKHDGSAAGAGIGERHDKHIFIRQHPP